MDKELLVFLYGFARLKGQMKMSGILWKSRETVLQNKLDFEVLLIMYELIKCFHEFCNYESTIFSPETLFVYFSMR